MTSTLSAPERIRLTLPFIPEDQAHTASFQAHIYMMKEQEEKASPNEFFLLRETETSINLESSKHIHLG